MQARKAMRATLATVAFSSLVATTTPSQAMDPQCYQHEVYFDTGSVVMNQEDIQTINKVTLEAHAPDTRVILVGKTDTVGSKAANQALSKRRAENVHKALIDNGIIPSHISSFFTGEENPKVATSDAENEPYNRVVRITVGVNCPQPK